MYKITIGCKGIRKWGIRELGNGEWGMFLNKNDIGNHI